MYSFWQRILAIFFPKTCVLCGKIVEWDALWCGKCSLPIVSGDTPHPFGEASNFTSWAAPFYYQGDVRKGVLRLKQRQDMRLVRFLAEYMAETTRKRFSQVDFDRIVEVPQSPSRQREIGYNHAAVLAQGMSEQMGILWEPEILTRIQTSRDQHALNREERMENAQKSYQISQPQKAKGQTILLVDDVFTTGATANACAGCLIQAGAEAVYVVTATTTKEKYI